MLAIDLQALSYFKLALVIFVLQCVELRIQSDNLHFKSLVYTVF
jgi:hypothetical protein